MHYGLMIVLSGLAALVVHECGHALAAVIFHVRIKGVRLDFRGPALVRERGPWFDCMMVSLAGPLANVAMAFAVPMTPRFATFMLANLCVGLIQLLPFDHSDGSRALDCWRHIATARENRRQQNGYIDPMEAENILGRLAIQPCVVTVKTQADAERLFDYIRAAGGDTSRLTISLAA